MPTELARVQHRARWGARVTVAVSCLAFCALGLLIGRAIFDGPGPWSPLGPYPTQRVDLPRNGDDLPVVSLTDGEVLVVGRKCVSGSGFTVTGTVSWQSVEPRGTTIRTGEGTREVTEPGCVSFEYLNTIPPDVARVMGHQIDDGHRPVWRIVGIETPASPDRGEGTPQTWATEPFRVTE